MRPQVGKNCVKDTKEEETQCAHMFAPNARWTSGLESWTGDRVVLGSNPAAATSLRNIDNSVYPALRLSEETLKAVGPLYLVSMPGEVKYPTSLHWKCVTCRGLHILA